MELLLQIKGRLPRAAGMTAMSDMPPDKPDVKPRESDEVRRRIIEEYAANLRELIRKLRQELKS